MSLSFKISYLSFYLLVYLVSPANIVQHGPQASGDDALGFTVDEVVDVSMEDPALSRTYPGRLSKFRYARADDSFQRSTFNSGLLGFDGDLRSLPFLAPALYVFAILLDRILEKPAVQCAWRPFTWERGRPAKLRPRDRQTKTISSEEVEHT